MNDMGDNKVLTDVNILMVIRCMLEDSLGLPSYSQKIAR